MKKILISLLAVFGFMMHTNVFADDMSSTEATSETTTPTSEATVPSSDTTAPATDATAPATDAQ